MSEQFPKISIVTASYNQGAFIEDCILSIIDQQYPNLEYIIIDGGSTDNTVDILKKYQQHITYWVSEKDNGLYDALNRGFLKTTGEIMGWLNSDDILMRQSLFTLADIFSTNPGIDWIQGHPCVADEHGRLVYQRRQRSSKYSFYLKEYRDGIFIQQESTYWRRRLWNASGACISRDYRYAGDFELWMRFYKYADQYITSALIGAFRMRKNQLSEKNYAAYLAECDRIIDQCISQLPDTEHSLLYKMKRLSDNTSFFDIIKRRMFSKAFSILKKTREVNYDRESQKFIPGR